MTIGTRLFTWLRGELVGSDQFGNRYYRLKRKGSEANPRAGASVSLVHEKRWVIYQGEAEGSKVPPIWHAWLHHTIQDVPSADTTQGYGWQKPHQPNLTGTAQAYRPPGSLLASGKRAKATGDYEPWRPS